MNTKVVIKYWRTSAAENWRVANSLFKSKHYSACLFYCHLTLEKLLKGLVVEHTKKEAPYIHNLDSLVLQSKIEFTPEQMDYLKIISTFNVAGRYDDIKLSFHKKCTKVYAQKYLAVSKDLYLWLNEQYQKK